MSNFTDGSIRTDVGAVVDTLAKLHEFQLMDAGDPALLAPFAVVPEGKKIESLKKILDEFRLLPDRRRGTVKLSTVESFVEIVQRFKGEASIVYADPTRTAPKLWAIFDYHPAGPDATKADWLRHQAVFAPSLSDEWRAWSTNNNKPMSQGDFAAFIEERVTDLIVPKLDDPKLKTFAELVEGVWASPSDMVKLSRSLSINVEARVKNAQTLSTGEVSIVYEETHKDGTGQPLKVPTLFTVALPVFYAGDLYRIAARLRYRVSGGTITWTYQLVRPDLVFDDAFKGIVEKAREETSLPVLFGTAEA